MHARHSTLTYRPIVPGSDLHLDLLSRAQRLGRVLYPDLYERRDVEARRRAFAAIHAAAVKVAAKQETPGLAGPEVSPPTDLRDRTADGCSTECA